MALLYRSGHSGLTKNDEEAVRLFKLSAAQGFSTAQYNLGRLYDLGLAGLPKDDSQALQLYKLAAAQGHASAIKRLREIEAKKVDIKITLSEAKSEATPTPISDVVRTKIRTQSCQKPDYPSGSRKKEEEGSVTLKFYIDSNGNLVKHEISKSSGFDRLDKAVESFLKSCKFIPATADGKNIDGWSELTYVFRLL